MGAKDWKLMEFPRWALLGSLAVVMFASLAWMSDAPRKNETVQNLQTAYLGEANAYVRYLAFAERAQEEEHGEVASLFRAAACAEHVHLKNHAAVLRKMGFEPVLKINTPVVKTTAENLRTAADAGEAYERDTMYPQFIKQARAEGNEDAARTFQYAMTAEAEHFKLFKAALSNLQKMNAPSHLYYVCNVCGYTAEHAVKPCPGCRDPKAEYEEMF
jgi:rubrerythrin